MKQEPIFVPGAASARDIGEWTAGWRTLFAGLVAMGIGWNFAVVISSLFLKPMQADFGWSRTELSFASLAGFAVAFMLPVTGLLLDRFGPRRVAMAGIIGLATAFLLFAMMPPVRFYYYGAVLCLAAAGSIINSVVVARGVAPWFERHLGAAIGVMMTGTSISAAVFVPLLATIIADHGWRTGAFTLAGIILLIGLPIVLLWFHEPPHLTDKAAPAMLRPLPMRTLTGTLPFWQLAVASGLASLPIGGFISHLIPLLTDRGLSPQLAAALGSVFAIAIGCGRIGNGVLLDRLHPPLVTACTLFLAAAGALCLWFLDLAATAWTIVPVAIALIGLAQGAEGDYITFFSLRLFGLRNFARVVSIIAMVISAGMALGGLIFAKIFDIFRSYEPAILGSVTFYVLAGLIFMSINMRSPLASGGAVHHGG